MRLPKLQMNLKLLIVVVACVGVYLQVWQTVRETDPTIRYLRGLRTGDVAARRSAVEALGDLGVQCSPGAREPLEKAALGDHDPVVRALAVRAIGQVSAMASSDALMQALKDPDAKVRGEAARQLGADVAVPGVQHALIGVLHDPDSIVRADAIASLGLKEPDDDVIRGAVFGARKDESESVRASVVRTFSSWLPRVSAPTAPVDPAHAKLFQTVMAEGLADPATPVRREAAKAIARLETNATIADPLGLIALAVRAMKDPDVEVRESAARSLGANVWLNQTTSKLVMSGLLDAVPALLDLLHDPDERPRRASVMSLRHLQTILDSKQAKPGAGTRDAIAKAVQYALKDAPKTAKADVIAAYSVVYAMAGDRPAEAAKTLQDALGDANPEVRRQAVEGLAGFVRSAQAAAQQRINGTLQWRMVVSQGARAQIGPFAQSAANAIKWYTDPAIYLDRSAERAMIEVIPALVALMDDPDPHTRRVVYASLWESGRPYATGNDALKAALRKKTRGYIADLESDSPIKREIAAWCLTWTDPADREEAQKALNAHRNDPNPKVRTRINLAFSNIGMLRNGEKQSGMARPIDMQIGAITWPGWDLPDQPGGISYGY